MKDSEPRPSTVAGAKSANAGNVSKGKSEVKAVQDKMLLGTKK